MKPPFSADCEKICTMQVETQSIMEDQNGLQY